MPFVAQRELQAVRLRDKSSVTYSPGDVISDFESWGEVAKRANLAMEWVLFAEDRPVITDKEAAVCDICNRVFKGKVALRLHKARVHAPRD